MNELVSILIPAYNVERWIGETIESGLNQTWPNKEIIIVDDGSTDHTLQILKKYESKRVKVISQENRGASAARNKALSFAQGDFIQWLDADDLLAPDKIWQQLKRNEYGKEKTTLLSSRYGRFFYRVEKAQVVSNSLCKDLAAIDWILKKFTTYACPTTPCFLVSRRLIDRAGGWNEQLSFDDDGEYFCRVVSVSDGVKYIPEGLSYYRIGNLRSLSNRRSNRALESLINSIEMCFQYLRAMEESDRTRSACLRYLQHWVWYFYPEKHEILERARDLAMNLGGKLLAPEVSGTFVLARAIMGWTLAKKIKGMAWNAEVYSRKNWDRLFFILSNAKNLSRRLNDDESEASK